MSEFYSSVREATSFPEYVDRKKVIRNLVDMWKTKAPIVAEVLAGRNSFEQVVEPLVKENLRIRFPYFHNGACCSEEFQRETRSISERLKDVLSLDEWFTMGRFPSYTHMASPVMFPKFQFGMMFSNPLIIAMANFAIGYYGEARINETSFDLWKLLTFLKWGVVCGLGFAFFQLLVSAPRFYSRRRHLARQVREKAQFLDRTLREVYQG